MTYEHLLIDLSGPIATVTLNRPEVRNALDERTLLEITDCFTQLGRSGKRGPITGARLIVLRGAGQDFCAGADIRWMRRASAYGPAKNRKDARKLVEMVRAVDECPLPVIARVHGGVYGGGLGIVSACDIVVAEENARMCFSECRLGILPAVVSTFVLPKIGPGHTRRLYLTAEVFDMRTAREVGLVHEGVPESELDARVARLAAEILRNGPQAVRGAKAYIRKMLSLPREERIRFSIEALVEARSSPEGREGLGAFLEKRPPAWAPRKA